LQTPCFDAFNAAFTDNPDLILTFIGACVSDQITGTNRYPHALLTIGDNDYSMAAFRELMSSLLGDKAFPYAYQNLDYYRRHPKTSFAHYRLFQTLEFPELKEKDRQAIIDLLEGMNLFHGLLWITMDTGAYIPSSRMKKLGCKSIDDVLAHSLRGIEDKVQVVKFRDVKALLSEKDGIIEKASHTL